MPAETLEKNGASDSWIVGMGITLGALNQIQDGVAGRTMKMQLLVLVKMVSPMESMCKLSI